jgi:predicted NAD-dependent protein-ADP-ribosyltransferase YbiA (DUF1768 family)
MPKKESTFIKSKLIDSVQYEEREQIEDADKGMSVLVYEYELVGKDVDVAVGKRKYKGTGDKMVAYFPIYLLAGDTVKAQIGVFEILPKYELDPDYLDADNELKLDDIDVFSDNSHLKLNLYSFVNKRFLTKYDKELSKDVSKESTEKDLSKESTEKDLTKESTEKDLTKESTEDLVDKSLDSDLEEDPTELHNKSSNDDEPKPKPKTGVFEIDSSHPGQEPLSEETKEDDNKMKADYVPSHDESWIKKYMKNGHYRIVDVEKNGDCFFAVIREAYARIGYKTSVARLRHVVADEVGETQFDNYREMYFTFVSALSDLDQHMRDSVKSNAEYKKRIKRSTVKTEREELLKSAKANSDEYKKWMEEKHMLETDLQKYRFMKGVDTLADFKEALKQSSYWADEMAISILEKKLNIKMIILSEENYKAGDTNSVMKCISGYTSEGDAIVNPDYYIIAAHTGDHYKLITYKNVAIFRFVEIPYSVKILIVNKCIERNSGSFQYISKFRDFQSRLGVKSPSVEEDEYDEGDDRDLYDKTVVFQFYNNSADKAPGKGSGDKLAQNNIKEFIDLRKIPAWRRMLDDEYDTTFHLDKKRWQTVEHYMLAARFKQGYSTLFDQFALDSNSDISTDLKKAKKEAATNEKTKRDPNFYNGTHKTARKAAVMAKFDQNENLRRTLLNTKKAKLVLYESGKKADPDMILMEVRAELQKQPTASI